MRLFIAALLVMGFFSAFSQKKIMYDSLNSARSRQNLPELRRSYWLEFKAKCWLMYMHARYNGRHVHGRGPEVLTSCIDPIGCWLKSPMHHNLIMSKRMKKIGIAIYRDTACGKLR